MGGQHVLVDNGYHEGGDSVEYGTEYFLEVDPFLGGIQLDGGGDEAPQRVDRHRVSCGKGAAISSSDGRSRPAARRLHQRSPTVKIDSCQCCQATFSLMVMF